MSLIYTCELNGVDPLDYLNKLQEHAGELAGFLLARRELALEFGARVFTLGQQAQRAALERQRGG